MPPRDLREGLRERAKLRGIFERNVDVVRDDTFAPAVPRWLKLRTNRDLRAVPGDALRRRDNFGCDAAEFAGREGTLRAAREKNDKERQ